MNQRHSNKTSEEFVHGYGKIIPLASHFSSYDADTPYKNSMLYTCVVMSYYLAAWAFLMEWLWLDTKIGDVRQIPFLCTQISQPGYGVVYIYNTLALALSRIKDYSYANVLKQHLVIQLLVWILLCVGLDSRIVSLIHTSSPRS